MSDFVLSRRQWLQALGLLAVVRPSVAFAQGNCGGARASLPECDPTPAKPPFASTGWKTVWLDHFSMQVADYQKEAAYFAALMNWKVRSDDGTKALLDIGDNMGILIRGGYEPPAPPAGGGGSTRAPRRAAFDGFSFGITPWDTKKVEAELKARGLNPVADHAGKDFQSFHVKDPNGWDLQISNGNAKNRRPKPANAKLQAAAPFASTAWNTVWLDHISFEVTDYKAAVAFYAALLGWVPGVDEGSQNTVKIGDIGGAIIRRSGGGGGRGATAGAPQTGQPAAPTPPIVKRASIGHISFGISPWDVDAVKAELDKRGLNARPDTGGSTEIHVAKYQSYHTTTPNGFDLQISNTTKATRDD
jgi:catechol 2,3-dioxygenase-like lactoylglutathione lyase family enzyme